MERINTEDLVNQKGRLTETETIITTVNNEKFVERKGSRIEIEYEFEWDEMVLERVTELVSNAGYIVFFSGAGISASAGIATFRGKTKLGSLLHLREEELDYTMPTYAHVAIAHLVAVGKAKYVVTSNHDNLHIKAGLAPEKCAVLFGSAYVERCVKCSKRFSRNVVCPPTGRYCDPSECGDIEDVGHGKLVKTGIRYGQSVPEEPVQNGYDEAQRSDLAIVLGSSMETGPFNRMPRESENMILVNPSSTYADRDATIAIKSKCDEFMKKVMDILGEECPPFIYQQPFRVGYKQNNNGYSLYICGDRINEPVTCFTEVTVTYNDTTRDIDQSNISKRFERDIQCSLGTILTFTLTPHEAYDEPALIVQLEITDIDRFEVSHFKKQVTFH